MVIQNNQQLAYWVTKVGGGAGSCNILKDSCKFPTEEVMGTQNFNVAFKSPKTWDSSQKYSVWKEIFGQKENFTPA